MDSWIICYVIRDGKYEWAESGKNLILTEEYDKVIPVEEKVARQVDKLEYDGTTLRLREGETLLDVEELDRLQHELDVENGLIDEQHIVPKLVEVEF